MVSRRVEQTGLSPLGISCGKAKAEMQNNKFKVVPFIVIIQVHIWCWMNASTRSIDLDWPIDEFNTCTSELARVLLGKSAKQLSDAINVAKIILEISPVVEIHVTSMTGPSNQFLAQKC